MTEWVVSNLEEALAKKQFPLYKSVFDRFTRIYVESKQVSVPMDILTMSLCECVTTHSEAIRPQISENGDESQKISPEEKPVQETPEEVLEEVIVQVDMPEITVTNTPGDSTAREDGTFSKEFFLQKLIDGGIKQNIIPLLSTADIDFENEIITIQTTSFAETRCRDTTYWRIIESVGYELGAKSIEIVLFPDEESQNTENESPTDIAREIFGA